jgi:predicted Holliday junction resolvase-like endonuclease
MNAWSLIIEAFKMLVERDTILSERLAKLEEETGLEITEESVTQTQLQELVGRMQEHLAPRQPEPTAFLKEG